MRPGGKLAYVTCSILTVENEEVADSFAASHPEFETYRSQWAQARLPLRCLDGRYVRLDPVRTSTDAFFLAIWKKVT